MKQLILFKNKLTLPQNILHVNHAAVFHACRKSFFFQSHSQTNTSSSFIKVGVWNPPTPAVSTSATTTATNKWIPTTSKFLPVVSRCLALLKVCCFSSGYFFVTIKKKLLFQVLLFLVVRLQWKRLKKLFLCRLALQRLAAQLQPSLFLPGSLVRDCESIGSFHVLSIVAFLKLTDTSFECLEMCFVCVSKYFLCGLSSRLLFGSTVLLGLVLPSFHLHVFV